MAHDQDIILPLQFHDNRFQPDDDVSIRLAAPIPVVELIFVACCVVFRVAILMRPRYTILVSEVSEVDREEGVPRSLRMSSRRKRLRRARRETSR